MRAVSIVGDDKVSKSWLIPFISDVVHKSSRIGEELDRLASPFARVDSTNEEQDVDQE